MAAAKQSASSVVRLIYTFADGEQLDVIVQAASSYPDALSQASAEAQRNLREGLRTLFDIARNVAEPDKDEDP